MVKNKLAAPFRQAEFDIDYGEGFSRPGELVDLGVEHKLVVKSGAWYSYGDVRIGQGRENAKQFVRDNPDLADELEARCARRWACPPPPSAWRCPPRRSRRSGAVDQSSTSCTPSSRRIG